MAPIYHVVSFSVAKSTYQFLMILTMYVHHGSHSWQFIAKKKLIVWGFFNLSLDILIHQSLFSD